MPERAATLRRLADERTSWPGIRTQPHRFGGLEFNLDGREIGHYHASGALDILFNKRIRDELLRTGRVVPHHFIPDSGWTSFYVHGAADYAPAL